jgi:hypothetical protein
MPIESSHNTGDYQRQDDQAPSLEREKVREFFENRKPRQNVPLPHGLADILEYFFGFVRDPTRSYSYASLGTFNSRDFVFALD